MLAFLVGLVVLIFGIGLLFVPMGLFIGLPCIACGAALMFFRSFNMPGGK